MRSCNEKNPEWAKTRGEKPKNGEEK